jgi:pilus assembly protein CpaE
MRVVIAREAGVLRERLRQTVLGAGLQCAANDCVSYTELSDRLAQAPADLVLIGLGAEVQRGLPVIETAAAQTKVPVFAVGLSSDSQQILQALRKGAREYLHEEDLHTELLSALGKLRQTGAAPVQWGKIITMTGAQPGIGVTTVACNVAFALAANYPGQVVLAELGGGVPELALDLDLQPRHSLTDLVASWDRLDTTLMRRALVEHPGRLSVLAYKPETLQPAFVEPPAMRQMLALLRSMFKFTVVDLGHGVDPTHLEAVALADKVVLVVRLDVPSVRLSRQYFHQLEDAGVPRGKLHVAANRYGQRKQFPWKKAQEALGLPIAEWIPDDPGCVNQAINQGQPLIATASRASITRSFAGLAGRLNGKAENRAG